MKQWTTFLISLFLFSFLWTGCSKDNTGQVFLRIINHTDKDFSSVTISFKGAKKQYDLVPAGDTSAYQKLEHIYSYGLVKATTDSLILESAHPTDYVGESPLKSGRYNGIITYSNDGYHGFLILDIQQQN